MRDNLSDRAPNNFGEQPRSDDHRQKSDGSIEEPFSKLGESVAAAGNVVHPRADGAAIRACSVYVCRKEDVRDVYHAFDPSLMVNLLLRTCWCCGERASK